jgi:hypothetical protein
VVATEDKKCANEAASFGDLTVFEVGADMARAAKRRFRMKTFGKLQSEKLQHNQITELAGAGAATLRRKQQ